LGWITGNDGYISFTLKDNERKSIENNTVDQCLETIQNRIDQVLSRTIITFGTAVLVLAPPEAAQEQIKEM